MACAYLWVEVEEELEVCEEDDDDPLDRIDDEPDAGRLLDRVDDELAPDDLVPEFPPPLAPFIGEKLRATLPLFAGPRPLFAGSGTQCAPLAATVAEEAWVLATVAPPPAPFDPPFRAGLSGRCNATFVGSLTTVFGRVTT